MKVYLFIFQEENSQDFKPTLGPVIGSEEIDNEDLYTKYKVLLELNNDPITYIMTSSLLVRVLPTFCMLFRLLVHHLLKMST